MYGLLSILVIFNLGFEAGGSVNLECPRGADIGEYDQVISWGAEAGVRDVLPGIGFDIGFRMFGTDYIDSNDSTSSVLRWEGLFVDGTAVFESWPYLPGPFGARMRVGASVVNWKMLADGEVIQVTLEDTPEDTTQMKALDPGLVLGGSVMYRPLNPLILEVGVNYRNVFSMNTDAYGTADVDESFLEVLIGARARF